MKKYFFVNPDSIIPFWSGYLVCLLIFFCGCCINIGSCIMLAKYERTVQLSAALAPGSTFAAQTHNGAITIAGADVADCNLTATITGRAATESEAKRIAEETKIKLVPFGNKLTAKIEKPQFMMNCSVRVSLNVTVPNHTDLQLTTHNGAVKITDITGHTTGTTHNGRVTASHVSGTTKLVTHNGPITCKEVSGDIRLHTHNGSVKACYSEAASPVCSVSLTTHNGGIDLTAPPSFSAAVEASTHNGSIRTDLPVTVIGKVSKRNLKGTIGAGQGKLYLKTHNGSIKIR